jgi:hypothetical protein
MADFTSYWLPQQVEDNLGEAMFHVADNNFNRVRVGDTVWIVTIRPGTGEFMLCARVPVDEITGQAVADKRLRGNAWKARYHVWCQRQDAEQVRLVSLEGVSAAHSAAAPPRNTTGQSTLRCPAQREITSAAKGSGQRARRRRLTR